MNGLPRLFARVPLLVLAFSLPLRSALELPSVPLPPPQKEGGKPLLQTLQERKTVREFSSDPVPIQVLSSLLWAAFGLNRPELSHRTAPSAMNAQEIDIYIAKADGLFVYDAAGHCLNRILTADIRDKTSGQAFAKEAPITLVYVADYSRMVQAKPEQKEFYSGIDTGHISQNVYLFCASENLGTVVHDLDRQVLSEAMKLRPDQKIVLAQAIGYPRK